MSELMNSKVDHIVLNMATEDEVTGATVFNSCFYFTFTSPSGKLLLCVNVPLYSVHNA